MSSERKEPSFWATVPGMLTAIAGVVSAGTGLVVALNQVGLIGADEDRPEPSAVVETASGTASQSVAPADTGVGDAIAGTWRGEAAGADTDPFEVVLEIEAPCHLRKPCGTISVSSAPCTGRVKLWDVRGTRIYELYVDRFTADSASVCTPGAGDFVDVQGDDTLRYFTNYSDALGILERVQ